MKFCWIRSITAALSLMLMLSVSAAAQSDEQGTTSNKDDKGAVTWPAIAPVLPDLIYNVDLHPSKLNNVTFTEPSSSRAAGPHTFEATAYTLRGRTATGTQTRTGIVAADPNILPLGSIIALDAGDYSGVYEVHDTGARVKGNLVDVWMPSNKEARKFGRRSVKLTVLKYGPARRVKGVDTQKDSQN